MKSAGTTIGSVGNNVYHKQQNYSQLHLAHYQNIKYVSNSHRWIHL